MPFLVAAVALLVAVELWSEARHARLHYAAKPLASTGFVGVALLAGALDSGFGRLVLAALALSWCGDVFLLGRGRRWFLLGLGSFLLAHVVYSIAFVVLGLDRAAALVAAGAMSLAGGVIVAWLRPHLRDPLRVPVYAYVVAIAIMVVAAAGAAAGNARWWLLAAALAFAMSDLGVARDRFVAAGMPNRIVGLPLYYAAQLLFAWQAFV